MRPIIDNGPPGPLASLYVHLPFCRERCLYCSFPTVADDPAAHAPLIDAVLAEARRQASFDSTIAPLETLYLGGGTPGLIPAALIERLLQGLALIWTFRDDVEITLEANPANIGSASLRDWAALGVNRLSVGVQTFRDDVLARLGRRHDADQARDALECVRQSWPHTWSADVLAGWAGQSLSTLEADLRELVAAEPPHVSVYALTVEEGTALAALERSGRRVTASAALEPALDARCADVLASAGYERYEVSNFARAGHRSRHNQVYWADRSYLGLGPGAASSVHPYRWVNRADLPGYLASAREGRPLRTSAELIAPASRLIEALGIGLRTRDGVALAELDRRFGPGTGDALLETAQVLIEHGLLERAGPRLRVPQAQLSKADGITTDLIVRFDQDGAPIPAGGAHAVH